MNILLVNWLDLENPQAGGAELHLFEIFGRIAARGHRIRLVASGWPGADSKTRIQDIDITRSGSRTTFTLTGRGAIRRALAEERPDIVVEDVNKLPLFSAGLTDVPSYVIVPHLFGTTAFKEVPWWQAVIVWAAELPIPKAYRRSAFHAISESTRDDLVARGVAESQVRVIHPGVDSVGFSPRPGLDRTAHPSFLYVGRLKRYKGVDTAIEALAVARQGRTDLTLEIAGTGDDRSRLEALARRLGVSHAVRFHGFVTDEHKLRLMRTSWANVFPSVKEGWGLTVIEAAACGTPSLTSNSPGLRDSVRDGVTGYLFPHGDAPALARRMLELAERPALVDTLGKQARAFAETLTWESAARATESHLAEVIAEQSGRET
ncbi:MAG TPA: glycosyltransferase family 4 protein [Gemmatimonadales bacterium]|nr:glycosyltransferase family 4 protein [Gemmatimonadales bacterium]